MFNRVTIIGLGLIGGSLGMAITQRRLARRVVGASRSEATIRQAKRRRAIDVGTTDAVAAVRDADLVVLATPVDAIVPHAKRLAPYMRPGSILTDVGSVKGPIVGALERAMPRRVAFIGSHPLAGSEQRGIGAASASLFEGSACIVTATPRTDRRALRDVSRLWKMIVRRVVVMSPERHDRRVAAISHLPHALAFCLMEATDAGALDLAARSFLDATRVAASDPELWDDIFLSNRSALLAAMKRFDHRWRILQAHLMRQDRAALRRLMRHAQATRQALDGHFAKRHFSKTAPSE